MKSILTEILNIYLAFQLLEQSDYNMNARRTNIPPLMTAGLRKLEGPATGKLLTGVGVTVIPPPVTGRIEGLGVNVEVGVTA